MVHWGWLVGLYVIGVLTHVGVFLATEDLGWATRRGRIKVGLLSVSWPLTIPLLLAYSTFTGIRKHLRHGTSDRKA